MSYNDKKKGFILPTRHGSPIGGANERQMLDQVGGSEGYRKNFRVEPDGTTTMLTTKNGQPQFQTLVSGGSDESKNTAGLASGAVFLKPTGETYYMRTTAVAAYAAPDAKVKLVDRIDKTLIGTQPKDKSKATAAVAFAPPMITRCPASLFTGKMRLYVQCLYGSIDALPADLELVDSGTSMPSLIYAGVPLDTSCGIYLNEATAKHYLISVTSGDAHELIRTPGVRWLEKKLLDPTIPSVEKAKIEAYLLAQSYPSPPQWMDLPPRIAGGMGYGWHFNWKGTAADCVGIETAVNPGDGQPCYRSTHWRITFSFVGGHVTGSLATVSTGLWRNNRNFRMICVPNWSESTFTKLGFLFLPEFGSGTIYAYYSHTTGEYPGSSTLQVSSWSATLSVAVPNDGMRVPGTLNPDDMKVPPRQGFSITTIPAHSKDVFSITAGATSVSISSSNYGKSAYGASSAVTDAPSLAMSAYKEDFPISFRGPGPSYQIYDTERPGTLTARSWYWNPGLTIFVEVGGGGFTEQSYTPPDISLYFYSSVSPANATTVGFSSTTNVIEDGYLIWFPVFWDSEAVYLWGRQDTTEYVSGYTSSHYGTGWQHWFGIGTDVGPAYAIIATYDRYWYPPYGGTDTPYTDETRTQNLTAHSLTCGSTSISVDLPFLSLFLSGGDDVKVSPDVKQSTRGAIYSYFFNIDQGNAPLTFGGGWAAYTGWA